jgi:hypothetical protein
VNCVDRVIIQKVLDARLEMASQADCDIDIPLPQGPSYGGRVVVPTKREAAVPSSGRIEGTETTKSPANLKVL